MAQSCRMNEDRKCKNEEKPCEKGSRRRPPMAGKRHPLKTGSRIQIIVFIGRRRKKIKKIEKLAEMEKIIKFTWKRGRKLESKWLLTWK